MTSGKLNQHWTSKHGVMVQKLQFQTLDEVLMYMEANRIDTNIYNPYVCSICGLWHIGHYRKRKHG